MSIKKNNNPYNWNILQDINPIGETVRRIQHLGITQFEEHDQRRGNSWIGQEYTEIMITEWSNSILHFWIKNSYVLQYYRHIFLSKFCRYQVFGHVPRNVQFQGTGFYSQFPDSIDTIENTPVVEIIILFTTLLETHRIILLEQSIFIIEKIIVIAIV